MDIGTAEMLVDLGQKRVFRMPSRYFDVAQQDTNLAQARNACRNVLAEIAHFLEDLHESHPTRLAQEGRLVPAPQKSLAVTGRELLLGSSFHMAGKGGGPGPGFAAWGRVALGSSDGEEDSGGMRTRIDGEVLTGTLGADTEWDRLLAGVAVSLSESEGTFDQTGVDKGSIESSMTTVSPYARYSLTERVSVWGLAGCRTTPGSSSISTPRAAKPRTATSRPSTG